MLTYGYLLTSDFGFTHNSIRYVLLGKLVNEKKKNYIKLYCLKLSNTAETQPALT